MTYPTLFQSNTLDSPSKVKKRLNVDDPDTSSRKRKSAGDALDKRGSPEKKMKVSKPTRQVKTLLKTRAKEPRSKSRTSLGDKLETHPKKKLATRLPVKTKKTFKPHRPMTRAATHLKSVLKAAKIAASRKLKQMTKSSDANVASTSKEQPNKEQSVKEHPSKEQASKEQTLKDRSVLSKIVETKRKPNKLVTEKIRASPNSSPSKSSTGKCLFENSWFPYLDL